MERKRLFRSLRFFVIRLSLQWKIALSILSTFFLFIPVVSMTLIYVSSLTDRIAVIIDQDVTIGRTSADLSVMMLDIRRHERNYRMFGVETDRLSVERLIARSDSLVLAIRPIVPITSRELLDDLANHLDIYANSFSMLVEHISQHPPVTVEIQRTRMTDRLADFQTEYREIVSRLDAAKPADRDSILSDANRDIDSFSLDMLAITDQSGQPSYIQDNLERSRQGFLEKAELLGSQSWDLMQRHRMESLGLEARAKRNIISILIITGLICLFMIFYLPRYIVRPINSLNRVFRRAEEGNLKVAAPVLSNDEIGDLARSFNRMIERLSTFDNLKSQKLIAQKRAIDRLLENLSIPACILSSELDAMYYNQAFAVLFKDQIPAKSPEGGLDIRHYASMSDFHEEIRKKLGDISSTIVIEFPASSGELVRMKGRVVRNALMKLESVVLVGTEK